MGGTGTKISIEKIGTRYGYSQERTIPIGQEVLGLMLVRHEKKVAISKVESVYR
jgi:hypothetical protein